MTHTKMEGRIDLSSDLQWKAFAEAMLSLQRREKDLTPYELQVFRDLRDAVQMFGRDVRPTVKQVNFIRQVAVDLAK